jgi:hypothetical protein
MSRTNTDRNAPQEAARQIWQRTRQTAQDAKPVVAAQVKPLAGNTKDAASRGLVKARAWAAPQVERTGQVIQDTVAPKVAAALTTAARRLEPEKPARRGLWRILAGVSAVLAAAGAVVAARRNRSAATATTADDAEAKPAEPVQVNADGAAADHAHTS